MEVKLDHKLNFILHVEEFMIIDGFPTKHKARARNQLKKLLTKGIKLDPRSARFFLKYGMISREGEIYKFTEKGIAFINPPPKKTPIERFFEKVEKTSSCWLWKAHKNQKGYGMFHYKKDMSAHKFSYLLHKGDVPKTMFVCHKCDTPSCVNPEHLWLGTNKENVQDSKDKGRNIRPTARGSLNHNSKLDETSVREIKNLLKEGMNKKEISRRFKISYPTILNIWNNKIWKHVKGS